MKKICLVQGGKFLLGIDAEHIVSRTAWAEVGPLRREGRRTVHLGALLARRPPVVQPEAVCLELAGREGSFFLLVDRIADEIETEALPQPLPPVCPFLAARLCPQVTVCGSSAVLLLDPAQAIPVCEQLGEGIGLLASSEAQSPPVPETRPALAAAAEAQEPCRSPSGPSPASASKAHSASKAEARAKTAAPRPAEAQEPCRSPSGPSPASASRAHSASKAEAKSAASAARDGAAAAEKERKERAAAIDEETFKKVMSWTIARFKQKQPGEHLHLGMEQLPSDLAGMVQKKGVSRSVIQYLIDQIVLRCQESVHRKMPGDNHAG